MRETGLAGTFAIGALGPAATTFPAGPCTGATGVTPSNPAPALLLSSSGTTGLPKIVVLSHRNLVASLSQTRLVHKVTADDVVLAALPLFHIFGMQMSVNLSLLEGATVVILPRFEPGAFLRAVETYRVTRAEIVPPMLLGLAFGDLVAECDVSSLRLLTSGTGYLGNPDATAAAIDDHGWLHTGDIVTADAEGWYRVVDRVKELIKYKGLSVAAAELEALLLAHPAVADVAVIRYPDETAGEVPKAYVVRREPVSEQELMDWVAGRVAPYKRVRRLEFTDSIPRSPSGKILRRLLVMREAAATGTSSL